LLRNKEIIVWSAPPNLTTKLLTETSDDSDDSELPKNNDEAV